MYHLVDSVKYYYTPHPRRVTLKLYIRKSRSCAAAIAVFAIVVLSSCEHQRSYEGNAEGRKVAIIGDTATEMSSTSIHEAFELRYQLKVSDLGRRFDQSQVLADDFAQDPPDVLVLQLGYFDAMGGVDIEQSSAHYDLIRQRFPQSCIVVVNLSTHTENVEFNHNATVINELYRNHGGPYIVNWDYLTSHNPALLGFDYIHPAPEAYQIYAEQILEMVDNCPLSELH